MTRKVDELGRIVLPAEYREALNIKAKDDVDLNLEQGKIIIQKTVLGCHLCGATASLVRVGNECFCECCIQKLHEAKAGDILYPRSLER